MLSWLQSSTNRVKNLSSLENAKYGGNGKPGGEEKEKNLHIILFLEIRFCKTQLFFSTKTP